MSDARPWELQCYGCAEADIEKAIEEAKDIYAPDEIVFSILSDVQELVSFNTVECDEKARQKLNIAKHIIYRYWKLSRVASERTVAA